MEDQADLVGDLDIETFPTLLVGGSERLYFLGTVTPQSDVLRRLLHSLLQPGAARLSHRSATQRIIDRLEDLPELWLRPKSLNR